MPFAARYGKVFVALAIGALFLLGSLGFMHFGMSEMGGVPTSNCPLMPGMTSVCNMNLLEHVAAWQSMFTTIIPAEKTFALMLLFLFALLSARALVAKIKWTFGPPQNHILQRTRSLFVPHYALQEAFSNGIIHPKVF